MLKIVFNYLSENLKQMKKILIILVIVIANTKNIDAQTYGVPDTLTYLQNIVANKTQFIGHSFSTLYNSLQIQIKFFSPFASIAHDMTKETSTSFSFYFPQSEDEMYLSYPKLRISWQPYLDIGQSLILYKNNNGGGWSITVANFYANAIIADIQIRE